MASILGRPIRLDELTRKASRLTFARVLVDMAIDNTKITSIKAKTGDGQIYTQEVEFENIPPCCDQCKCFGHLKPQCPMTSISILSYVAVVWLKIVPVQRIRSKEQFLKIAALSLIFCGNVVAGNVSLRFLAVSFNQAVGSTTPFFTAVFASLLTVEKEGFLTYLALLPVVAGVIIATVGEPSFHLFGFIMCVSATAARALKTVVQGILLSSEGETLDSMNLLLYMAPTAVVFLLPASLIMEGNVTAITIKLAKDDVRIVWYLLLNSALAYFVNLTNFLVTKYTSALTLQVLGNAKGAVAVVLSILIFRNPVSVSGMLGYTLTVIGVLLYSAAKKRNKSD